ncbi:MAG TPA: HAMP domain-containing sensor histidine kinase, partial [Methylomirabilota bacterium]|nr:HAMP domain-containing sensor histidine kinase [Methylomirabilota bacterium]
MSTETESIAESTTVPPRPVRWTGLSGKLLVLTVLFVMLAEVLIFVPSIANFHKTQIEDRLRVATVAARALTSSPATVVPEDLQLELLDELDAHALAVREGGMKQLLAMSASPPMVTREISVLDLAPSTAIMTAFDTLLFGGDRAIRAIGPYREDGSIDVVFSEAGLRKAMLGYSKNILLLSIVISGFSAILVYVSLRRMFVKPMQRLGDAMRLWAEAPDDPARVLVASGRDDEFGQAERQIADMQRHVQEVLVQQRRLADLGLAVSKINHDLRNLLASAQLLSDRLATIQDPAVQRFAPKLIAALDRAIAYAEAVLAYGKAQEAPPARRLVQLRRLVTDVAEVIGLTAHPTIEWCDEVPAELEIDADSEQLFRVLMNLLRNSMQALEQGDPACVKRLCVGAERSGSVVRLTVRDTGPGVPTKAREALFKP